jgi:phosphatidylinositol-3-phosphatase
VPADRWLEKGMTVLSVSAATLLVASGVGAAHTASPDRATAAAAVPAFDHVLMVVEENHSYSDIINSSNAPYINSLARQGASFTDSHAITHPSQPNYLALFSGSPQGVTSDSCPHTFSANNLGHQVGSFTGYSESLPSAGYTGCTSGSYARKHSPWINFSDVPASANQPYAAFPSAYGTLPKLSVVIPNLRNDMHDGSVAQGDSWLQRNLDGYAKWATSHNSLLIVTWDEDDNSSNNRIPTIFAGAKVKQGTYNENIDHYDVLRTLEDSFGVSPLGSAANASAIGDVWN